jgi:hypothetical protein
MILSRVINWPDGPHSAIYECRRCWIAVTEPSSIQVDARDEQPKHTRGA